MKTHLDHAKGQPCPICDPDFYKLLQPSRQTLVAETDHSVITRPEGVEPGKVEIVWRKK